MHFVRVHVVHFMRVVSSFHVRHEDMLYRVIFPSLKAYKFFFFYNIPSHEVHYTKCIACHVLLTTLGNTLGSPKNTSHIEKDDSAHRLHPHSNETPHGMQRVYNSLRIMHLHEMYAHT